MICSNIKLTGPAESIGIDTLAIHEWNQRDLTMNVQRKLEILANANLARSIPQKKALPFIVLSDHRPPAAFARRRGIGGKIQAEGDAIGI